MSMRRVLSLALLCSAGSLPAQSIWDSSVRLAPTFQSYDVRVPFNETISQFSVPMFATFPVLPALTIDVGTAFATATLERRTVDAGGNPTTVTSEMSGLTDTQVRANYMFGQDFVVLTLGVNAPTGSATLEAEELEAATRIGSDFLMFPISGFGSGLGFTGGVAVARPLGSTISASACSARRSGSWCSSCSCSSPCR